MRRTATSAILVLMLGSFGRGQEHKGEAAPAPRELPAHEGKAAAKGEAAHGGPRLVLGQRTGEGLAFRKGLAHTTTSVIDVVQPRADTVVVTMTGLVSAAGLPCEGSAASLVFDVCQHFAIVQDGDRPRPIRLILEAQLMGLLRVNREGAGAATIDPAEAVVTAAGSPPLLAAVFPARNQSEKGLRFINDKLEPTAAVLPPGMYELTQRFALRCEHPKRPFHKNVALSAFGGESARIPEWLILLDPNRDLPKGRPLGYQVTLRVEWAGP